VEYDLVRIDQRAGPRRVVDGDSRTGRGIDIGAVQTGILSVRNESKGESKELTRAKTGDPFPPGRPARRW